MDEIIAKIVSEFEPGELITHDYLWGVFDIRYPTIDSYKNSAKFVEDYQSVQFKYMTLVDQLRDGLLEKEFYYLKNIRGDGYVLMLPKEQVQFAYDRALDEIKKSIRVAKSIMLNVRTDAIPPEQIAKNHDMIARISGMQQLFATKRK